MAESLTNVIDCPICLETPKPPIRLCQWGHSICADCIGTNAKCPLCRGNMTDIRNFQLEQLIAKLQECAKVVCRFAEHGCKYVLTMREMQSHEPECKNREFGCEGKGFCGWPCEWRGPYGALLEHFKGAHDQQSWMEFKTAVSLTVNFDKNYRDIQIISFSNGQQLFWYKFKVDVDKQKAYWIFQYVGPQKQAKNYYYEFEVYDGAVRKFKVNDVCESDATDVESLFDSERCVTMGFKTLKTYTDKSGKVAFRFRIMKIKKDTHEHRRRQ